MRAEGKNPTEQEIQQRAENNAMRDWGVGGKYQQITQAVTGALQGVFNDDLTQALANGSAPFLAEAIKNATTNPDGSVNTEANLAAHAILGALLSQANGNSALAGGLGALTAEAAAKLIKDQLYGDKSFADLTGAERQNISALAQIAAAVAGGLAGDSSSDTAQGAIAGKNAVENNYLSSEDKSRQTYLRNKNNLTEQESAELLALNQLDAATSQALLDACLKGSPNACEAARKDAIEKQASYQDLTYQYPKEAQEGYQQISGLLADTNPDALATQQYVNGLIQNYVRWGFSEEEAKRTLGYQMGLMSISGGLSSGYSLSKVNSWLLDTRNAPLTNAANKPFNSQGLSVAARAIDKHAVRPNGVFDKLKGNIDSRNTQANAIVQEILDNSNTTERFLSRGGVEYRLLDGRGLRFNADGSFSTVLDPNKR